MAQDLVRDDPIAFVQQALTHPTSMAHPATEEAIAVLEEAKKIRESEICSLQTAINAIRLRIDQAYEG